MSEGRLELLAVRATLVSPHFAKVDVFDTRDRDFKQTELGELAEEQSQSNEGRSTTGPSMRLVDEHELGVCEGMWKVELAYAPRRPGRVRIAQNIDVELLGSDSGDDVTCYRHSHTATLECE